MNWEQLYLVCFGVGLVMSVVFLLSGAMHVHLPGKWGGHVIHAHGAAARQQGSYAHGLTHVSPFNLFSMMAFLAWFGGAGYLLTHYYSVVAMAAFGFACVSGMVGGAVVFFFLTKVMLANERVLGDEDGAMVGVIGRVNSTIREAGTGEIVFTRNGKRGVSGARSESGAAIARNTEIVVTRYERGLAYVREWEEFAGEVESTPATPAVSGRPESRANDSAAGS